MRVVPRPVRRMIREQRKTDLEAARGYAYGQSKMIEAAKGHAIEPGSPIVDCQKAYAFQPTPFEGG